MGERNDNSIEVLSRHLVSVASEYSNSICEIGSVAHRERLVGVVVGRDDDRIVASSALIVLALSRAEWMYRTYSTRDMSRVINRIINSCGHIGSVDSGIRYSRMVQRANSDLRGQEAARRLGILVQVEGLDMSRALVETSVEWFARTLAGTGYLPKYVKTKSEDYQNLVGLFDDFVSAVIEICNLDSLYEIGGFAGIDVSQIPNCPVAYDVFISYRRVDGDICARLLFQELEHRGYKCFLDVDGVNHGAYNIQILSALRTARNFVFIKSEKAFEGVDDPEDHVRIELDAAMSFEKNIVIVAPPRVSRNLGETYLPSALEPLRNLRAYRLDVGEAYVHSMDIIVSEGIRGNMNA